MKILSEDDAESLYSAGYMRVIDTRRAMIRELGTDSMIELNSDNQRVQEIQRAAAVMSGERLHGKQIRERLRVM